MQTKYGGFVDGGALRRQYLACLQSCDLIDCGCDDIEFMPLH